MGGVGGRERKYNVVIFVSISLGIPILDYNIIIVLQNVQNEYNDDSWVAVCVCVCEEEQTEKNRKNTIHQRY